MATSRARSESEGPRDRRQNAQGKRASVACARCRGRRTKCVMPDGQTPCEFCQKNSLECVVTEDERRRPSSKAYINSLRSRISLLEGLLQHSGHTELIIDSLEAGDMGSYENQNYQPGISPCQNYDDAAEARNMSANTQQSVLSNKAINEETTQDVSCHLNATRFLLPEIRTTVSSHIEATNYVAIEDIGTSAGAIMGISVGDYDYLMSLYWTHFNSILRLVDRTSFEEDRKNGGTTFFSKLLESCLLAIGFEFVDHAQLETDQLRLSYNENPLHTESTRIFEEGLDKSLNLPNSQAMVLLGDLECRAGRLQSGGDFVAMASKAYPHFKVTEAGISTKHVEHIEQSKHAIILAITLYGQFWTMLEHPTHNRVLCFSSQQMGEHLDVLINHSSLSLQNDIEAQIHRCSSELLVILVGVNEFINDRLNTSNQSAYLDLSAFDSQLDRWYTKLPLDLKWRKDSFSSAPPSYFLLHQQYHASLIYLHRNFAYCTTNEHESDPISQLRELSRTVCIENAIRVSIILEEYRQKHDARMIFVIGLQHITSASAALVNGILLLEDPQDHIRSLYHLNNLAAVLSLMRTSYKPATQMFETLKTSIRNLEHSPFTNSCELLSQSTEFPSDTNNALLADTTFLLDSLRGKSATHQQSREARALNINPVSNSEGIIVPEKRRESAGAVACSNYTPHMMCDELDALLDNWEGHVSLLDGALLLGLGTR